MCETNPQQQQSTTPSPKMEVSEAVAVWQMPSRTSSDFVKFFNTRYLSEVKHFSKMKTKFYQYRYKYDDDEVLTDEDIADANKCVVEMNICLCSLNELDNIGKEHSINYKENPELFMANKFVVNFKKGHYDKIHNEMCEDFTESKILRANELM